MKQRRMILSLMFTIAALSAALLLLWSTRVRGWESNQDRGGKWRQPRGKPEGGVQAEIGAWRATTATGRIWPWRPVAERWPSLAQRDPSGEPEWMDLPGFDPHEQTRMFNDLRRVNRWLGGNWMTLRGLDRLIGDRDPNEHITILDVASGSADIPRMLSEWACQRERHISIVATDINPEVLKLAKDLGSPDSIGLVAADAARLPFADNAYDVAACSFFLHHLDRDDAVDALREMRRVCRGGVLINDMVRGWPSYLGAWFFSRTFTRNRISRHDALLSARRSYSRAELEDLAARAGLEPVVCYGFFGYRLAMVTAKRETVL